ncbi:MAG: hypothetical protein ACRDVM_01490, partial [Acidimicrobiia bacterium]
VEAGSDVQDELRAWLELPGRQPLVVIDSGRPAVLPEGALAIIGRADQVWALESSPAERLAALTGRPVAVLEPWMVPELHRPGAGSSGPEDDAQLDGVRLIGEGGDMVGIVEGGPSFAAVRLAAAGIPLVGLQAPNWPVVEVPGSPEEAGRLILDHRDRYLRLSVRFRRAAHGGHSVGRRLWEVLHRAGLGVEEPIPPLAGLLVSNKPALVGAALAGFARQTHPRRSVVVGLHGDGDFRKAEEAVASADGRLPTAMLRFPAKMTLGACLNAAAEAASAPLLAKIDDDDHYGPHYLEDAVQALAYSGAEVVGKSTHFVFLEGEGRTLLVGEGKEEQLTRYAPGPTLVFRRRVWEDVAFPDRPQRVDSIFVRGCNAVGADIYSTSRFEFVWARRAGGHTWEVDPAHFLARGEPAWDGWEPDRSHA